MLVVFAGGMVASGLLGEPILGPLKNSPQLLVATICWYIVFYTPFDIGYKFSKFLPVKLVSSAMKEIYRAKKVRRGRKITYLIYYTRFHRFMTELFTRQSFTRTPTSSWSLSEHWRATALDSQSFSSDLFVVLGHQQRWNLCSQVCKFVKPTRFDHRN